MTLDPEKVRTKVQFIRDALRRLEVIRARGEEAFLSDPILQDAALRSLQVAIQAVLDTAHHIVAREGLGVPKDYRGSLAILIQHGICRKRGATTFSGWSPSGTGSFTCTRASTHPRSGPSWNGTSTISTSS